MRPPKISVRRRSGPRGEIERNQAIFLGLVALFLLLYGSWFVYDRFMKTEEDRVRAVIQSAAQGARDRSPRAVSSILASDFRAPGNVNKELAHEGLVVVLMQQYREIDVTMLPDPIPVVIDPLDKTKAIATFRVTVRGKIEHESPWDDIIARWSPVGAGVWKASFKKTEDGWKMQLLELTSEKE